MSDKRSLSDILSEPVKESEIGDLFVALNGFETLQTIVRRLAYQRPNAMIGSDHCPTCGTRRKDREIA